MEKQFDVVNNPQHYTSGGIECIDAMISARGAKAVIAFCECNAFKYLWRAGAKDDEVQDLRKAKWYIDKSIELISQVRYEGSAVEQMAEAIKKKEVICSR